MVNTEKTNLEHSRARSISIVFSPRRLRLVLIVLVMILSALGLLAEVGFALFDRKDPWGLFKFASLSWEENLPTWAASSLLLLCAGLLLAIGRRVQKLGGLWSRHWFAMSAIFAYVSLDETAQLHENLGYLLSTGKGILYYDWVIPATGVLLVLGMIFRTFIFHLPTRTRSRFILAAVLYVGGALFMELPLGYWVSEHGSSNLGYGLIDWIEETLELAGVAVFLYALTLELFTPGGLSFTLEQGKPTHTR
jgi:hypothetical protein